MAKTLTWDCRTGSCAACSGGFREPRIVAGELRLWFVECSHPCHEVLAQRRQALKDAAALRARIEVAGDRLSRAASAVARVRGLYSGEAYDAAAAYDGGEWSGPAMAASEERQVERELAALGYTAEAYNEELRGRVSGHFAHFSGLLA